MYKGQELTHIPD